ncbi:phage Gp37/Gp68 family protein [Luteolibacter sp. GHJ8]|uniref:Phage Gp37/Gp68 family protein n=1 Tax=Luteolibacter rhizosphaerae TaxID=2989719 RepID=A0ABT3G550_9BACT|nr:phage Gp37/Gp68 family protein [Luteolibacter rhizosphaerae]MCW1914982.1 phage Gp37/Gp68 family protein [Luteolibacter rhizosphaerae]
MASSSIEWTELTWNPTTGCDKISSGCKFCYAEIMSRRLQAMGVEKYRDGFKIREHEAALAIPFSWRKPAMVFVNSMSDLFHKDVSLEFIQRVFGVMNANPHLVFQVLTKRADRLAKVWSDLTWSQNIWIGVSVEDERVTHRIDDLRGIPAAVRFLSCEPLIGPLSRLNLDGIDWVIVGGESGARPRPMKPEWATEIRDQCARHDVAFFFKQWGGRNKKAAGRELDGAHHNSFPTPDKKRVASIV